MVGERVTAVLGDRGRLDGRRVDLGVQLDPEREVVGQAAVEGDAPALVDAEEVHLTRAEHRGDADPGEHQRHGEHLRRGLPPLPPGRLNRLGGPGAGRRRRPDPLRAQPGLLGAWTDEGGAVVGHGDLVGLLEAERDHRDVVAPPGLVGRGDQLGHRLVEALGGPEDGCDAVVLDHRGQPVRAEEEDVVGAGVEAQRVDLHVRLRAQRPGDDRALRVILGLLVGDPALAPQLLDQRVVGGQQSQRSVSPQVGAAVADVGERDIVTFDHRRGERRPHAGAARVLLGEVVDALVGGLGDPSEVGLRGTPGALVGLERLRRDPRSDLAGLGAPHPVGDGEDRGVRVVGVLVRRPLAPGVRPGRRLSDPQRHQSAPGTWSSNRNSVSPILIRSRSDSSASPCSRPPFRKVPLVELMSST